MKITTIATSYERKFNLGDYNSLKLEVTCWADLEEGDSPNDCIHALQDQCRGAVRREYLALKSKLPAGMSADGKSQVAQP